MMKMDKQAQDKRWNELSEESKKIIKDIYDEIIKEAVKPENQKLDDEEADDNIRELWGKQSQLIELFGYDNLNPKPTPKTWEDVEKAEGGDIRVDSKVINPNGRAWGLGLKYHQKAEATLKLAILIELGYGGMVGEEEWKDSDINKFSIVPFDTKKGLKIVTTIFESDKRFIAFHTLQQVEEFMSHESNRKLVEMYYLM